MPDDYDVETHLTSVTVWDVAFAAVLVAALLAAMMLWSVHFMSCRGC